MGDPYLNGPAFLAAEAQRQSEESKNRVKRYTKQELMQRGDIIRILNADDLINSIRKSAIYNYNSALERLLNPSKRLPNETTETLRAEAAAHKVYVDDFDLMEKEGKQALKKLLQERNGKEE